MNSFIAQQQQAARRSRLASTSRVSDTRDVEAVSGCLSLYVEPPKADICIEDFERFAIDRLRVLKGIEEAKAKGDKPHEVQEKAKNLATQHLKATDANGAGFKDHASHFVLRLAYCRTEDLRRWFLMHESDLFKARFDAEGPSAQVAFMAQAGLHYDQCTPEELNRAVQPSGKPLWQLLAQVEDSKWNTKLANEIRQNVADQRSFFKVDFEQVPDLVAGRKVLLLNGTAYVSRGDVASLVVGRFRSQLSQALASTSRKWASHIAAEESERLTPIVEALSTRYLGPDYGDFQRPAGEVAVADLPRLAHESFPLCMLNMFDGLKRDHHLKHTGRQQLGNFLKGIGLSLDSALSFWRTEFAKGGMPEDKFKKEHMYNIRHSYGKEGKRVNYTPASCMSVINSNPGEGVVHGCPYKSWKAENVAAALSRLRVDAQQIQAAVSKAQGGHFQLACAAAWHGAHGCECVTGINHPNQVVTKQDSTGCFSQWIKLILFAPRHQQLEYYSESRKVLDEQMGDAKVAVDTSSNSAAKPASVNEAATPLHQAS